MGVPEEVGRTVRLAVRSGWSATAKLCVIVLVDALASAVFMVVVVATRTALP